MDGRKPPLLAGAKNGAPTAFYAVNDGHPSRPRGLHLREYPGLKTCHYSGLLLFCRSNGKEKDNA